MVVISCQLLITLNNILRTINLHDDLQTSKNIARRIRHLVSSSQSLVVKQMHPKWHFRVTGGEEERDDATRQREVTMCHRGGVYPPPYPHTRVLVTGPQSNFILIIQKAATVWLGRRNETVSCGPTERNRNETFRSSSFSRKSLNLRCEIGQILTFRVWNLHTFSTDEFYLASTYLTATTRWTKLRLG